MEGLEEIAPQNFSPSNSELAQEDQFINDAEL